MKSFLITVCILALGVACLMAGIHFYNRSRAVPIALPSEQQNPTTERESQRIRVEVLGAGRVRVGGTEMSLEEMEQRGITEHWKEGPGVLIVTFDNVVYTDGIAVLDAVRRLGIDTVGLETKVRE